ncbi:enhancer of split m4 protein [Zeugodacus cucurbitae]|nr:enhancer of split m4 protein [Zeugodacus cucurbitae]
MYTAEYENSVNMTAEKQQKKVSYSIKRLLKQLFKTQQQKQQQKQQQQELLDNFANTKKVNSLESLESLENSRNADLESVAECISLESCENDANERLAASCDLEDYEFADITTVPVHFLRTAHGTFFWTANTDLPADNDLIEPLYCSTGNQIATTQMQDRWAQA